MMARLRGIQAGEMPPATEDLNFYTHELREFVRYRQLGFESGLPEAPPGWQAPNGSDFAREVWLNTHTATLDDYGLPLKSNDLLYHPSVRTGP
jgi:hypothetical protein